MALLSAAGFAGAVKLIVDLGAVAPRLALPFAFPTWAALRAAAPSGVTFGNLGFAFDPSLLMLGFGAIIGLRAGLSLLIGAIAGWLVLSPLAIANGWAQAGAPDATWYGPLITWLLWPGVTLLVVSSLTSSLLTIVASARRRRAEGGAPQTSWRIDWRFGGALAVTAAAITVASHVFFDINPLMALLAVALSFILAIVACRVTGETGITPIGALGKVTQLTFGLIAPGNMAANLMTANVTGGAAGQSADLMTDLRTGLEVGATPRLQIIAQSFGILVGSVVGTLCLSGADPRPGHDADHAAMAGAGGRDLESGGRSLGAGADARCRRARLPPSRLPRRSAWRWRSPNTFCRNVTRGCCRARRRWGWLWSFRPGIRSRCFSAPCWRRCLRALTRRWPRAIPCRWRPAWSPAKV